MFKAEFWILVCICCTFYNCIYPFMSLSTKMFNDLWHFDSWTASVCSGIVYDVALVVSIPIGSLVDKVGYRLAFMIGACLNAVLCNLLLYFLQPNDTSTNSAVPWVTMALLAFSYCIMHSALWSSVPLVVNKLQLGSAMAVMTGLQMLSNSLRNLSIGPLSSTNDIILFVSMAIASACFSIVLWVVDSRRTKTINRSDG